MSELERTEYYMKFKIENKKRLIAVLIAVFFMGLAVSLLVRVNFGTDPCSSLNLGISSKLGISFGTWQVIFNSILLVLVFLFDRSQIGWGTLANMILVGYIVDFFTWVFDRLLPSNAFESLGIRIIVLIPSLALLILSAAVYMAVELGSAPYDAVAFILARKLKKVPFRVVRMVWDITAAVIGGLLGSTIGVVTVVIAFALGPVITWVKEKVNKVL